MLPHINIIKIAEKLVPQGWEFKNFGNGSCAWIPKNWKPSAKLDITQTTQAESQSGRSNASRETLAPPPL